MKYLKFNLGTTFFIAVTTALMLWPGQLYAAGDPQAMEQEISVLKSKVQQLEERLAKTEQLRSNDQAVASPSWDPFNGMRQMQEEMNRMFQNAFGPNGGFDNGMLNSKLSYDQNFKLQETKDGYEIRFDIAGFNKDKIDIEVRGGALTISGQSTGKEEQKQPSGYMQAQSFGSFAQTISLPEDADTSRLETRKEGDTLIIKMPKRQNV